MEQGSKDALDAYIDPDGLFMQKARSGLDRLARGENSAVAIFCLLQLLKIRERERIPLKGIRPRLLDREASVIQ